MNGRRRGKTPKILPPIEKFAAEWHHSRDPTGSIFKVLPSVKPRSFDLNLTVSS
jgi:hypothetical protein